MSELKLKKIGKQGYMLCIGADGTSGDWYFMTDPVKKFFDSGAIKEGDAVEIEFTKTDKKINLNRIKKAGTPDASPAQSQSAPVQSEKSKWTPPAKGGFQRSPADNESIKRQAIGHMTSRILSGMCTSGMVELVNVEAEMERIYKKFVTLVG